MLTGRLDDQARHVLGIRLVRRILTIAVLLTLLLASNAQAGWKIDRARVIAEYVWHYNYGCPDGIVSVSLQSPTGAFRADKVSAWTAEGHEPLMWSRPFDTSSQRCTVYINSDRVARWGMTWIEVCSGMIHEYGHLAGQEHSTNPLSIMYPNYRPDRRCRKRGRPYIERHDLYPF